MSDDTYNLGYGFNLYFDLDKVTPVLDKLDPALSAKVKQFIWNKAFEHSLVDFRPCGENDEYRFFIMKSPSLKISYRDLGNHWTVYSIIPYPDDAS